MIVPSDHRDTTVFLCNQKIGQLAMMSTMAPVQKNRATYYDAELSFLSGSDLTPALRARDARQNVKLKIIDRIDTYIADVTIINVNIDDLRAPRFTFRFAKDAIRSRSS